MDFSYGTNQSFDSIQNLEEKKIQINKNELKLILVLDTNILITNLGQLEQISQKYATKILFSIPWIVLQELDALKTRRKPDSNQTEFSIGFKAQKAIRFVHSVLKSNNFIFENSIQVF